MSQLTLDHNGKPGSMGWPLQLQFEQILNGGLYCANNY